MNILVIVGLILAFLNPVIGGVLVGYLVWLHNPIVGLQLMILSLTVMSLFVIGFMVWAGRKIRRIEQRLESVGGK
ncbi:hypothetical protein ACFLX4_01730 [Chloroflexota bacterium]